MKNTIKCPIFNFRNEEAFECASLCLVKKMIPFDTFGFCIKIKGDFNFNETCIFLSELKTWMFLDGFKNPCSAFCENVIKNPIFNFKSAESLKIIASYLDKKNINNSRFGLGLKIEGDFSLHEIKRFFAQFEEVIYMKNIK